jgi:hypothetical protein
MSNDGSDHKGYTELKDTIDKFGADISDVQRREIMQQIEAVLGQGSLEKIKTLFMCEERGEGSEVPRNNDVKNKNKPGSSKMSVPVTKHHRQFSLVQNRPMAAVTNSAKQEKTRVSKIVSAKMLANKPKNELDRLHEQIKEMYHGKDILNLSGPRTSSKPKNFYSDLVAIDPFEPVSEVACKIIKVEVAHKKSKIEESKGEKIKKLKVGTVVKAEKILIKQANPVQPVSKVVASCRGEINHFAFSICRTGIFFSCKLCAFESTSNTDFVEHINSNHRNITWNKLCGICETKIGGAGMLADEFEHLLTHLNDQLHHTKISGAYKVSKRNHEDASVPSSTETQTTEETPPVKLIT